MPQGDAELSRDGHGRFVTPSSCRYSQSPLLQGVSDLEQFLARLNEQGAKRSPPMSFECCTAFEVAALGHARVKAKVGDQLFAVTEATHIAHRRHHSVQCNQIDPTEPGQSQAAFPRPRSPGPCAAAAGCDALALPPNYRAIAPTTSFATASTPAAQASG